MRTGLTHTLCVLSLVLGGCFSERTDYVDGELACSVGSRKCPPGYVCAPDGKCYRSTPIIRADGGAPDAGPCAEGTLSCRQRDVMRCQGGQPVYVSTCDVACSSGFCLACEPDSLRCNGSRRQQCTATGGWADLPTCPAATPQCQDGQCVAPCSPVGGRRCSADGTALQECEAAGQFRDVVDCQHVCLPGDPARCGGECTPRSKQCGPDETPQTCSDTGEWVSATPCAGICTDGTCSGECRPSDTRCASPTTVQTCGMSAMWGGATPCAFVCDATTGECGGVCTPNARRCNGTRAEVCSAGGAWELDRDCGQLPCTGGSCTPCVNDTTQCNAGIPQRCVGGDWVNQRADACPFLCDATAGCVGECVPGSEICAAGGVHRVCGADALYDDEACDFVCLAGDCAGVCKPGARRCNGETSQRCSSQGAWGGGTTCAFGCDTTIGECKACVAEPLEETCKDGGCGTKANNCGDVVTCPACTGTGESCAGGGTPGFCGCTAEAAQVTCQDGLRCAATENNCGQTVECPDVCVAPKSCGGGGVAGSCGCTALTKEVACAGKNCGTVPDGCGGTISCWPDGQTTCSGTGATCGGGGVENVCGCTVNPRVCDGRECGTVPNNCGGTSTCLPNMCAGGTQCDGTGHCVAVCTPKTCEDNNFECGPYDPGCGALMDDCGNCMPPPRPNETSCNTTTHTCFCDPAVTCTTGKVCGTEPDGCVGTGTVPCGPPCPLNRRCAADQLSCECIPAITVCAGKCGAYTDGDCSYQCGDCLGTNEVCNVQTNVCECMLPNPCPTTNPCGQITDACGKTWDCGMCPIGACLDNLCVIPALDAGVID